MTSEQDTTQAPTAAPTTSDGRAVSPAAVQVGQMLDYFGAEGCSDIHLTPSRGLWYVKDKQTLPYEGMATIPQPFIDQLVDEFAHAHGDPFSDSGQLDSSFDIGGEYRGRLAARRTHAGTTMTFRIISRRIPTTAELELPASLIETVRRPAGLLLFTGQTGSGKSTSIAALVNDLNMTEPTSIYTLEDPIEYVYPEGTALVNQREVGEHVKSFAVGLENAKRSHPKIIIIGEIKSADTARAAVDAAASGHLVVSTMHAGSTAEAIDGLISMFPPNEQPLIRTHLSQVLLGVVVQMLIPRIQGGLAMAQEIAFNTRTFSTMLRGDGKEGGGNDMNLIQQYLLGPGRQERMQAMEVALKDLVVAGKITAEQARNLARDQRVIQDELTTAGIQYTSKD